MNYNDFYERQADNLYNLIMSKNYEWRKSWASDNFLQQSANNGTAYRRSNQLNLFSASVKNEYSDPRWLTFNQIKKMVIL